jgi:hypothetical protein
LNAANEVLAPGPRRVGRALAAQLLLLVSATLQADDAALYGAWIGGDRAAEAVYETMAINRGTIAWGSPGNPNGGRCETTWREVFAGRGEDYPGNQQGPRPGRNFDIIVLALAPADCARGARFLLFALPSDAVPARGYAEIASFDEHWSQTGWHNFMRGPAAGN